MNVRFGIVGCGSISISHAKAICATPGAVLAGATDMRRERADAFCQAHGGAAFSSFEAMLKSPSVDAVCILTPSGLHAPQAAQAIQAGKHVLVEKPMALTLKEADALIALAKRHDVRAGTVSQMRFADAVMRLKRVVAGGALGRIVTSDVSMKFSRDDEYFAASPWRGTWAMDGGGALMNQGIHGIDTLLYVTGPVKSVYGLARTLRHPVEVEDTAVAVVEFASGALGYIQGTTSVYPGFPRRLSVSGTRGTITLTGRTFTEWEIEGQAPPDDVALCGQPDVGASRDPANIDIQGHICHIRDMVKSIQTGCEPAVGFEAARRTIQLICAIYESSRTGKRVDL